METDMSAGPVVQFTPDTYRHWWLKVALVCGLAYFVLLGLELYLVVTKPLLSVLGK
jgi:NhaP-type Na+/H+ or K+/H+ antiporter